LDPTKQVLPEDGDRIQSPKRYVLKEKQDDVLDKDKTMDNVRKRSICTSEYLSKSPTESPHSRSQGQFGVSLLRTWPNGFQTMVSGHKWRTRHQGGASIPQAEVTGPLMYLLHVMTLLLVVDTM
jgi:hypothetical protein